MITNALVAAVKLHARLHYNEGGWDVVAECYSDQHIAAIIGAAETESAAIDAVQGNVAGYASVRSDVQEA